MKKIYIAIIALVIGFANACLAFQVHSMLFCLLPLLAFALGYFSSWKTGLLSSFLLFIGYTTATALMRVPISYLDPIDYLFNFVYGGFVLCIIGCGALTVKKGTKSFKSISVLVLLALLVSWCGYLSFPRYSYCYQVIVESSEDLSDLELYLPMGAVSQEPYTKIYGHPFQLPEGGFKGGLLEDYSLEMIDTKYGKMLKLDIPGLQEKFKPGEETVKLGPKPPTPAEITPELYPYNGSIIFDMAHAPRERPKFMPKLDAEEVKVIHSERFMGPIRVRVREVVEEFKVPLRVSSDKEAEVEIWLNHHGGRHMAINFTIAKGEGYSESVELQTATSDEWVLADGEAVSGIGVSGVE